MDREKNQKIDGIKCVCIAIAFEQQKEKDERQLKEGFEKFREALEQDAKQAAARGSGLPKDWRNRILK